MISWPSPSSLWLSQIPVIHPENPVLEDLTCDVAIAGGGFTGLWSAYYLKRADPSLRISVFEAKYCGYGASGRNGGWASALFASSKTKVAKRYGRAAAIDLYRELAASVDEIGKVTQSEGIAADFYKGGTVTVARNPAQLERLSDDVALERGFGFGPEDFRMLEDDEIIRRIGIPDALGAAYTPNCARLHPAKLVRGLRSLLVSQGVEIFESSLVSRIEPHLLEVNGRKASAGVVIDALEGYRSAVNAKARKTVPIYSLMIATEPLSDAVMAQVGLGEYETFADERRLIIYGQRSADNRIVFGGRGAPYHFGSGVKAEYDSDERVFAGLEETLKGLFPVLGSSRITHRWGGPLGVPRDFFSSVSFDEATQIAFAGGYVGDGVTMTNIAGRILSDLITGRRTELSRLCIVNHPVRRWEPEPLRYMGINAGLRVASKCDEAEAAGRPSPWYSGPLLSMVGQ